MCNGTISCLFPHTNSVALALEMLCSTSVIVSICHPTVGHTGQILGAGIRSSIGGITLDLLDQHVPLGTGGAGGQRVLQSGSGGGGSAKMEVHVLTCVGAAD